MHRLLSGFRSKQGGKKALADRPGPDPPEGIFNKKATLGWWPNL
ncbi:hypothetical protein SynRS9902_01171 [Synechococcus sp. RS9902]|nr:hypothetical protein SynRS9902_01171 [Synechococcus sp. RS9902]